MPRHSITLPSDGLTSPQPLIAYKLQHPPSLLQRVRDRLGSMCNRQQGLDRGRHQQDQQRSRSRSPPLSQIPQTYRDRNSTNTHQSSVQFGEVSHEPAHGLSLHTGETQGPRVPEPAYLAPTKPDSGSDSTLPNNNYATYYNKASLERNQGAAFVGAHDAPFVSDQAPNPAQHFDSRHGQVQAPSRALNFPNQILPHLTHVPPTTTEVQRLDAEELREKMEVDEIQEQLHTLTNLSDISKAEEAVTPPVKMDCNVLLSSDPTEEIETQIPDPANLTDDNENQQTGTPPIHDSANLTDDKEDQQTGTPLIHEAPNNIPTSKPADSLDGATERGCLATGPHWFRGEIVIRRFQHAMRDSNHLEAMPQFDGSTRHHNFWTDGSLPNGGTTLGPGGSAAVWKDQECNTKWNSVMARTPYDTTDCTEAELYAIQLALQEAVNRISRVQKLSSPCTDDTITILTDSQAALKALTITMLEAQAPCIIGPRQYVAHIINLSEILEGMDVPIVMRWVPGHSGAYGNEVADRRAREAARFDGKKARPPDNTEKSVKNPRGCKVSRRRNNSPVSTPLTPEFPWMKRSPQVGLTPAAPISAFDLKVTTINAEKRVYSFALVKSAPKA